MMVESEDKLPALTPMMTQYMKIKQEHKDYLLFYAEYLFMPMKAIWQSL